MRVQGARCSKPLVRRSNGLRPCTSLPAMAARPAAALTITSPHPDALRRRQEAETEAKQRQMERERERCLEAAGLKWWQQCTTHMPLMGSVQQFEEQLERHGDKLVVAALFSEECYVCKSLHPKLHKIAEELVGEVVFVKLNGSCPSFHSLFEQLNITSVPWFLFIRDGKIVHGMSTSLNPERLAAFRRTLHDLRSAT